MGEMYNESVLGELSPKHKRFVVEYLLDLNASAAYLRAGYQSKNPDVDAYKLLVKPSIQKEIQRAMEDRSSRTKIEADTVLHHLAEIAFSKTEETRNRLRALELLGKHLGLFSERAEFKSTGEIIVQFVPPENMQTV